MTTLVPKAEPGGHERERSGQKIRIVRPIGPSASCSVAGILQMLIAIYRSLVLQRTLWPSVNTSPLPLPGSSMNP